MAGSPGAAASADYIASRFRETGYQVEFQDFGGNRRNVVARSGNMTNYVVIGAHYDGQGPGMPSASDNAAGVALLLDLARDLKEQQLPVSIVAVAFDDEEQGMNGSRYFVDHSPWPLDHANAAIIFDTLGRNFMDLSQWALFVMGTEYSTELAVTVQKHTVPEILSVGTDLIGPRSDFAPFAVKRVPYLFFTNATNADYHGRGDTPDRMDFSHLAQDAGIIEQIAIDLARQPSKPGYLDTPIYPSGELSSLLKVLDEVEKERRDIPEAYRLMFADLKVRVTKDSSRELRQLATAALLGLATPRLSAFPLNFLLGPYYESINENRIAAAIYEESLKWSDAGSRQELQDKIRNLRKPD
jgi:hypothetical protein